MAISMNTENSDACSSPRISFSNDLQETKTLQKQEEVEVIRVDKSVLLESNSEFNFCTTSFPGKETYCPADELFFNGMIIPTQMKQKLNSINGRSKDEKEEEEITGLTRATLIREEKAQSNSVWRFKRSSSLNCENYGNKKSSIWSLPLLFRSKSTGSSSVKSSEDQSKHSQKNSKCSGNPSPSLTCSLNHNKPPLKKSGSKGGSASVFAGSYPSNNGVRNSHVLNVPSPYIAKGTSDLLGFSSLFGYGSMEKKSKK
ncbi:uncharacterized protein LOC141649490 [Silene latifolia]|uniref:uncharacterized protein LOC141649490 n=1 Tax=Silene latifolia TaxID=37657 RepID=UPI003D76E742